MAVAVLAGLGVWAAPSRLVALIAAGIGIGIGAMMCGPLIGLAVMRQIHLDRHLRQPSRRTPQQPSTTPW
ncbi:hypothetical protein ACFYW8_41490 [Streptomyces sp. NPDC002742]|uniref:hypothetical protein n=1 Tax=Streptomyces sp. NPDC002742 TaxID=3364663 RepID=UPI0036BA3F85